MADKRVRVVIHGDVQGVGFRAHCQYQALELGLNGWVRNRWDGTVEALFEGSEEAVDAMVRWCHQGPPAAEVARVDVDPAPAEPAGEGFHIRHSGF